MPKETFFRLRADKQEIIMRSAIREFNKNGFKKTKVGDIADEAEIAKGSLYQYFDDKQELYFYCCRWALDVVTKRVDRRVDSPYTDIYDYFRIDASKTQAASEEWELMLFMQNMYKEPDLIDDSLKEMLRDSDEYFRKFIRGGQSKGIVRSDMDEDILITFVLAVAMKFKERAQRYVDHESGTTPENRAIIEAETEKMIELLKNGMGC